MSDIDKKDYEVGYRKPPKKHQFKVGQPNPRGGRKKGQKNFRTDFLEELETKIEITEGSRKIKISKQRALIKRLINGSLNGDHRAAAMSIQLLLDFSNTEDLKNNSKPLTASELKILKDFVNNEKQEENDLDDL